MQKQGENRQRATATSIRLSDSTIISRPSTAAITCVSTDNDPRSSEYQQDNPKRVRFSVSDLPSTASPQTPEADYPAYLYTGYPIYEEGLDADMENSYVLIGKQRRRMSNAVSALDLDVQQKRRSSYEADRKPPSTFHLPVSTWAGRAPGNAAMHTTEEGHSSYWPMTSTEQFMSKHSYKMQLSNLIQRMDHAFPFLNVVSARRWPESVRHGLDELNRAIEDAWKRPLGSDLAAGMADHLRSTSNFDALCKMFIDDKLGVRQECGKTIENYFSDRTREYIIQQSWLKDFLSVVLHDECIEDNFREGRERRRLSASLLESLIRHGPDTCVKLVECGALEFLLRICRWEWENGDGSDGWETLRDIASAMCNLAVLGGRQVQQAMVEQKLPHWMFVLLSHQDKRIRFYACLVIGVIANDREFEAIVESTQTLPLIETFLQTNQPAHMAPLDFKYRYGRSKPWLAVMTSMLRSTRSEVQALACFQLAKEAYIRRNKENGLQVFEEVGALPALKEITSSPMNPLAAGFAEQILKIVGEAVPKKLSQAVPLWTVDDVEFWVRQVGFTDYAPLFSKYRVDGDLLLRTNDRLLINEIGVKSEYERMRFMRELHSLKRSADYSCVDSTRLDMWMMGLDRDLSVYTYEMLLNGIDRRTLIYADENVLLNEGGVSNAVHRMKIFHAIKEVKHVDELDIALLRKNVDIFICYRRSTGSQLASLLKVHLQLRGYKVFIDVDRLYAGQFDTSLLKNIRAAKHFILVLTQYALDRCVDDHACKDWVHLEIRTALEFGRNIIPVQDKGFVWPEASSLPVDIRPIAFFNAVQWVHEYQEACVEKLDKFLKGEHGSAQEPGGHTAAAGSSLGASVESTASGQTKMVSRPMTVPEITHGITKQMSECGRRHSALKRSATVAGRLSSI